MAPTPTSVLSDEEARLVKFNNESTDQGFLGQINSWFSPNPGTYVK